MRSKRLTIFALVSVLTVLTVLGMIAGVAILITKAIKQEKRTLAQIEF